MRMEDATQQYCNGKLVCTETFLRVFTYFNSEGILTKSC